MLALVARGRNALKAMRGVCSSWQQGFEASVTKIRIFRRDSLFPADGSFSERFSGLVILDIGDSRLDEAVLSNLAGLKQLKTLNLGRWSLPKKPVPGVRLSDRLTGVGFQHLVGFTQLRKLSLRFCENLVDSSFEYLRGLSLTDLDLAFCSGLTGSGLKFLSGMRLVRLILENCSNLQSVEGLQNLPLVHLSLEKCSSLESVEGLRNLRLVDLNLWLCGKLKTLKGLENMTLVKLKVGDGL